MIKTINYPFTFRQVKKLRVGDMVYISGRVITGRDSAHKFLYESVHTPIKLALGAIYHCGPIVIRDTHGWKVHAAGPTTSIREEPYMANIIRRYKITVIIGKGGMGEKTSSACVRHTCVYLDAIGGAAQILGDTVKQVIAVYYLREFGPTEAMWELQLENFPALVTIDSRGRNLHEQIAAISRRNLGKLL